MKLDRRRQIADRGIVSFMLVFGIGLIGSISFISYCGMHLLAGEGLSFFRLREFAFSSMLNGTLIGLGFWFILFLPHKSDL
ncbi:hypothetical protein AB4076_17935 [Dyella sp. 2RAF44]|jgi:hypothetical protein|uniref:hypothetical protein n=1 Tax=Dyella sp. 2RAF44 TaxID=3233000 RepID=UPI003F8DCB96